MVRKIFSREGHHFEVSYTHFLPKNPNRLYFNAPVCERQQYDIQCHSPTIGEGYVLGKFHIHPLPGIVSSCPLFLYQVGIFTYRDVSVTTPGRG